MELKEEFADVDVGVCIGGGAGGRLFTLIELPGISVDPEGEHEQIFCAFFILSLLLLLLTVSITNLNLDCRVDYYPCISHYFFPSFVA